MPKKKIRLPDGQKHEIDVPENATPAQIQFAVKAFRAKNPQIFTRTGPRGLPLEQESSAEMSDVGANIGGIAGSVIGSAGGPAGAIAGATIGASGGAAADQLLRRALGGESPPDSSAAAEDIGVAGVKSGLLESFGIGVGKLLTKGATSFFNRINSRKVANFVGNELAKAESPAQFGKGLQDAYDMVKMKAGEELGRTVQASANLPVNVKGTIQALENARDTIIGTVGVKTARAADSPAARALSSIEEQIAALRQRQGTTTFADLAERDSALAAFGRELDPGLSSKLVKQVREAVDKDFGASLPQNVFQQFKAGKARYAELSELGRANILKSALGNERIADDLIAGEISKAPETALAAVKLINKQGEVFPLKRMQRAIFLESFKNGGTLPKNISTDMINETFGKDAAKVHKFFDIVSKGNRKGSLINFGRYSINKASIGGSDESGALVEIPFNKVAKLLDDPKVLDEFVRLAEADKWGQATANSMRVIFAALAADDRKKKLEDTTIQERMKNNPQDALRVTP